MMTYQLLTWDSDFFGFKVARILPKNLGALGLKEILVALRAENIALAYWAADPDDPDCARAATECRGFLTDRKVTFALETAELRQRPPLLASTALVEEFAGGIPTPELEALAVQAGAYSRFRVDPRIPEDRFLELYRLWICKSVTGELAEKVFVVRDEAGIIVGMVTAGEKDGRGDIGLLAVDNSARGRGLGVGLVAAAQQWALDSGYATTQVVTQGDNVAACRLYERCGYHIDRVEHIYHFWSSK
jgi:dTDP-4-amino-4,6-dideoxy-D-galactose acyltransferase